MRTKARRCNALRVTTVHGGRHLNPAPRRVLILGDWPHIFVCAEWTANGLVSTSHLRRPRMKTIVAALLTPPSCQPLVACTVLTLLLSVLDRDSQDVKVCGTFSVVHILNSRKLHVTDGAAGRHSSSACPCTSASMSTRCLPRCPCQSEIQPPSPPRVAPTTVSREVSYLFCSLDRFCTISSTTVPVNSHMAPSRRSTCQVHTCCKDRESGVDERAELECHAA